MINSFFLVGSLEPFALDENVEPTSCVFFTSLRGRGGERGGEGVMQVEL